jgi:DNA polymerase
MKPRAKALPVSAADFLPARNTYDALCDAARACRGCHLYMHATQTVFGAGDTRAGLMLVGEQPGDMEDVLGRPFAGSSGRRLEEALDEAGIARESLYVTNAVKHFKFEVRGHRRVHKTPNAAEVAACRPWLMAEIALVRPKAIVCLGATAARSLLGNDFKLLRQRGRWAEGPYGARVMATYHPAAALRARDAQQRERIFRFILNDIVTASLSLKDVSR